MGRAAEPESPGVAGDREGRGGAVDVPPGAPELPAASLQRLNVAPETEPALGPGELAGAAAGAGSDIVAVALDDEMAARRRVPRDREVVAALVAQPAAQDDLDMARARGREVAGVPLGDRLRERSPRIGGRQARGTARLRGARAVVAIDLKTGKSVWEYESGSPMTASPAVANGVVVIGTNDGTIIAFGA